MRLEKCSFLLGILVALDLVFLWGLSTNGESKARYQMQLNNTCCWLLDNETGEMWCRPQNGIYILYAGTPEKPMFRRFWPREHDIKEDQNRMADFQRKGGKDDK